MGKNATPAVRKGSPRDETALAAEVKRLCDDRSLGLEEFVEGLEEIADRLTLASENPTKNASASREI